jgi:hypothetical protein
MSGRKFFIMFIAGLFPNQYQGFPRCQVPDNVKRCCMLADWKHNYFVSNYRLFCEWLVIVVDCHFYFLSNIIPHEIWNLYLEIFRPDDE